MKVLLPVVLGLGLCAGCAAEVGDECSSNVDCSPNGDRVCDTAAPGGYCTILGCRAGSCPEEAVCVAWGRGVEEREFCMRTCGSSSDCRDGYQCFDPGSCPAEDPRDCGVVLPETSRAKFCIQKWP